MNIDTISKIPDIQEYSQYFSFLQISNDISLVILYKQLFRSEDVLVDVYLNEISENTKMVSGKKLESGSLVASPKYDLGFKYYIFCVDQDFIKESINIYNANKFYLQFCS